jgi:hypothetical protein
MFVFKKYVVNKETQVFIYHYYVFAYNNCDNYVIICILCIGFKVNFFKVYQNLVTMSLFSVFLPSFFLPCKDTFMNDYDGI